MDNSIRNDLVQRVIDKFNDDIEDPHKAVSYVIANAKNDEIESVAKWGLYQAYKEHMRGFGPGQKQDGENSNENPDQQNDSKFNGINDKLSYPLPIDSSGETKPLKEWTMEDVKRRKSYLHGLRDSIEEKIKYWDEIEHEMEKNKADRVGEIGKNEAVKKVIKSN